MTQPVLRAPNDDTLSFLTGVDLPSEVVPNVVYRLGAIVGRGGMSVVFSARRIGPEGSATVVVKVLRPSFVQRFGETAMLVIRKEAVALGRLNERVPPTPFVVRLLDTAELPVQLGGTPVSLPYVVLEYVHGGPEGTTLTQRVQTSLRAVGHAFEPARAAHAIECIATGLQAVHEAGVVHRDLTPKNVLCCGFGETEIFKIADFGVARPVGLSQTLGGQVVGTVGYAAPEISTGDRVTIGPHSDVFSFAAVTYFLLTGEHYFPIRSPGEALMAVVSTERRSLLDARGLHPDLRKRPDVCKSIDFTLGWGSSAKVETRLQLAPALAAMLVPPLRALVQPGSSRARPPPSEESHDQADRQRWRWAMLAHPSPSRIVRGVAWDGDGRCLVATTRGLMFWSGTTWQEAPMGDLPRDGIRFVRRIGAGRWLVGGDQSLLAVYGTNGVLDVVHGVDSEATFEMLSGSLDDVAVLVSTSDEAPITLWALAARSWLKPYALPGVQSVTALTRLDERRWLVAGRHRDTGAMIALFSPLDFHFEVLDTVRARAFLSAASLSGERLGLVGGAEGNVVWVDAGGGRTVLDSHLDPPTLRAERVDGSYDLSASGLDITGRGWVAGVGHIWARSTVDPEDERSPWRCVFEEQSLQAPIVSLFLEPNLVLAMTADGAIVEGRSDSAW
jgi:serine/threonine protein kinase